MCGLLLALLQRVLLFFKPCLLRLQGALTGIEFTPQCRVALLEPRLFCLECAPLRVERSLVVGRLHCRLRRKLRLLLRKLGLLLGEAGIARGQAGLLASKPALFARKLTLLACQFG